jgi:hypothetical protein
VRSAVGTDESPRCSLSQQRKCSDRNLNERGLILHEQQLLCMGGKLPASPCSPRQVACKSVYSHIWHLTTWTHYSSCSYVMLHQS